MTHRPAVLFGVPIDNCTVSDSIEWIAELVRLGRMNARTHQVATVNVDFLVNALNDAKIMNVLQHADLNLADGMPVIWLARLLGTPLPERVAGADLVPLLAQAAEVRGWRVHLFGAAPGVADRARSILVERFPGAQITSDAGPNIEDPESIDDEVVASVLAVDPDVLCVALGNPKQERFIATYRDVLRCPVMIGVGGSLDMLVGDRKRAPALVQRLGVEWIFRAIQEPRRLGRRYARDVKVFGPAAMSYWATVRTHRSGSPVFVDDCDGHVTVRVGPPNAAVRATDDMNSVALELGDVAGVTPEAHSLVVGLVRHAHLHGLGMSTNGWSGALRACFEDYGTWPLLATALQLDRSDAPDCSTHTRHSSQRGECPKDCDEPTPL